MATTMTAPAAIIIVCNRRRGRTPEFDGACAPAGKEDAAPGSLFSPADIVLEFRSDADSDYEGTLNSCGGSRLPIGSAQGSSNLVLLRSRIG
jgi:hypothetical protein